MLTIKQKINIVFLFDEIVNLSKIQLDYINNHITDLVKDSITKGNCVNLRLTDGFEDDVMVNDYTIEFTADVECNYDKVSNAMIGKVVDKIEEIDTDILMRNIKHELLVGDFNKYVIQVFVEISEPINDLPNSSV